MRLPQDLAGLIRRRLPAPELLVTNGHAGRTLLFGLKAFGQIERCRITGYKHLAHFAATAAASAA